MVPSEGGVGGSDPLDELVDDSVGVGHLEVAFAPTARSRSG